MNSAVSPSSAPAMPLVSPFKGSGNRCGHNPDAPRWHLEKPLVEGKGGNPYILTEISRRLLAFYAKPQKIPSLNYAKNFTVKKTADGTTPTKKQFNQSDRQQRSERREAALNLLICMISLTEIATLRVGQPTKNGFMYYTLKYLAKQCGISYSRAKRAHRDLVAANIISIKQARVIEGEGLNRTYKGLPGARAINKTLFSMFGLGEKLKRQRKHHSKKLKKTLATQSQDDATPTRTARARTSMYMGALSRVAGQQVKGKPYTPPPEGTTPADVQRQLSAEAVKMKRQNPEMTTAEIWAVLKA